MTFFLSWNRCKSHPARTYFIVACGFSTLVLLGAWTTMAGMLRWQWTETLSAEMRQNTNTALALKEHTLRILATVDQAMELVQKTAKARALTGASLVRIANETGMMPHILTQLSFINAEGHFQGSNLDPEGLRSQNVRLMDREHIRVHLLPTENPNPPGMMKNGLFISKPLVGKVSGVWSIQLTRKIVDSHGTTLGVVAASLNQSHFIDVYRGVELGSDGGVVLAGLDGVIRVRVIGGQRTASEHPLPLALTQALITHNHGALLSPSSDGVQRISGFSRVGDYELAVLSGTSQEQAFAAWRTTRNIVLILTALLSLSVIVFVALFLGSIRRLALSHEALTRSEAQAQRANQAKSEFLAAMSHELRTPLTSIRGFSELMEVRSKDPLIREQAQLIRQGAEHLNTLLTEILDLAKIEAGAMSTHPQPVQLRSLLHDVVELFRVSAVVKSLALTTSTAADVPATLVTDRLKLQQILHNLLSNAIKFTAAGAVKLVVKTDPQGSHVLFHITDTGPGIAPELHARIFEKFSQGSASVSGQHGGTGLGLSLSRSLAQLLGGTLTLQSSPGQGATFMLALPLPPPAVADTPGI